MIAEGVRHDAQVTVSPRHQDLPVSLNARRLVAVALARAKVVTGRRAHSVFLHLMGLRADFIPAPLRPSGALRNNPQPNPI